MAELQSTPQLASAFFSTQYWCSITPNDNSADLTQLSACCSSPVVLTGPNSDPACEPSVVSSEWIDCVSAALRDPSEGKFPLAAGTCENTPDEEEEEEEDVSSSAGLDPTATSILIQPTGATNASTTLSASASPSMPTGNATVTRSSAPGSASAGPAQTGSAASISGFGAMKVLVSVLAVGAMFAHL